MKERIAAAKRGLEQLHLRGLQLQAGLLFLSEFHQLAPFGMVRLCPPAARCCGSCVAALRW